MKRALLLLDGGIDYSHGTLQRIYQTGGSGRTLTQFTKQLGFGGREKAAVLQAELAAPLRPGELADERSRKMRLTVRPGSELPESMTDSNRKLDQERQKHNRWLVLIAAYKFDGVTAFSLARM